MHANQKNYAEDNQIQAKVMVMNIDQENTAADNFILAESIDC